MTSERCRRAWDVRDMNLSRKTHTHNHNDSALAGSIPAPGIWPMVATNTQETSCRTH